MKKFIVKSLLIFSPFVVAIAIEVFVLPIDFFTFRVYEALRLKSLPGKFYPNMEITRIEEGDLAAYTRFAYKRKVTWITDRYGYRKQNTNREKHEIVIVGDSFTIGTGLTQEDIFSEVLEKKLKVSVYPLAPASLSTLLEDDRFRRHPPDIIILERKETRISLLPPVMVSAKKTPTALERRLSEIGDRLEDWIRGNRFIQVVKVYLDRICKESMFFYLRASLRRLGAAPSTNTISTKDGFVSFVQGAKITKDFLMDQFDRDVNIIANYNEVLKSKEIRFIFLPIPCKENIYYKYLQAEKPIFLEQLISTLRNMGIETIDTQKAFDDAFQRGVSLYQRDDSHWNAQGVKLTVDLIEQALKKDERKVHRK